MAIDCKSNADDVRKVAKEQVSESIRVKNALLADEKIDVIVKIAEQIITAYNKGKKIIWFGNGGSAADAQHLACELVSTFEQHDLTKRHAIRSISLTTNTSVLTAIGNDFGFVHIFSRQVEGIVEKGDIVIGLSTSGNSANVIDAMIKAKSLGAVTVAFTGEGGGKMAEHADILLDIPHRITRYIQEAHMTAGHTICWIVENRLFGSCK